MALYELKYMYDWGCDTCVWCLNESAYQKFDGYIHLEVLPISPELRQWLSYLCTRHNGALNWADPASGLAWSTEEQETFREDAYRAYEQLCKELGEEYSVHFREEWVI